MLDGLRSTPRILVDIVHPADVHFFKHVIREWERRGHTVLITARDKDVALQLLHAYDFRFRCISTHRKGLTGLASELVTRDLRLLAIARTFRPDVLVGFAGISIAHVGAMLRRPSVVFYDTEFATLSNLLTYPLATVVCTPDCYTGRIRRNHVRFPGYKELAYLHPHRFTPERALLQEAGIALDSRFFIVRFVSWGAAHDLGERGLSDENKLRVVRELARHGRVVISSEGPLPAELASYTSPIAPDKLHHLMAFATLYVGESATMASECAVLGVPAIYIATTGRGYTAEQQHRYGLVFHFSHRQQDQAFQKMTELLGQSGLREEWARRRALMLLEKVDVTTWIVDFMGRYTGGCTATDLSLSAHALRPK